MVTFGDSMAEIERKWRLERLPPNINTTNSLVSRIHQGYILDGEFELRLRKEVSYSVVKHITLAVKSSGDLSREEWPIETPEWVFDGLWSNIKSSLVKTRYTVPSLDQNHAFEFDVYQEKLEGLFIVECEFDSEEEAEAFTVPDWFGLAVDVTKDPRYKNKNLANLASQDFNGPEILKILKG